MVTLEGTIQRYIGLSTDVKPIEFTPGHPLPAGSSFFETDTFRISRFDGSSWYQEKVQNIISGELLAEQKRTNELLELVLSKL